MAAYNTLFQRTRELYGYVTKAIEEFRSSYATGDASFCGPCGGGQVNSDMSTGLATHHARPGAATPRNAAPIKPRR